MGLALRRSPDRKALEAVRLTYYASVGLPAVAERSDDAAADAAFAPMVRFVEEGAPVAAIAAAVEEAGRGGAPALAALRANATAVAEQRSATAFLVDLLQMSSQVALRRRRTGGVCMKLFSRHKPTRGGRCKLQEGALLERWITRGRALSYLCAFICLVKSLNGAAQAGCATPLWRCVALCGQCELYGTIRAADSGAL